MINLIIFETKKFFNRKKNIFSIALFLVLVIVFVFLNLSLEEQYKRSEVTSIDFQIDSLKESLSKVESEISRLPENDNLKVIKSDYEEELDLLKDTKVALANKEYHRVLENKIKMDKLLLKGIESENTISSKSIKEIEESIQINTYLIENNIEPIFDQVSMQGFNFIRVFLNNPISIILIILIIILSADIMSSEFDSNTYKLLFIQPISRKKILLSKVLATIIIINVIIFTIIGVLFGILGIINGFGNMNYPVKFYNNGITELIGIGKFILLEFVILGIISTFTCVLSLAISSLNKSTSNSIAVMIIITIGAYMISSSGLINKIAHVNPFAYFNISSLLQGDLAILYDNYNVDFKFALLIIPILTIMILIANIVNFEKKYNSI